MAPRGPPRNTHPAGTFVQVEPARLTATAGKTLETTADLVRKYLEEWASIFVVVKKKR